MKSPFGRTEENWYLEEFKQGQKVEFIAGDKKGTGKICGISSNGIPLAGKSYIIELDERIEGHEYSHISLPEIYLNPIETPTTPFLTIASTERFKKQFRKNERYTVIFEDLSGNKKKTDIVSHDEMWALLYSNGAEHVFDMECYDQQTGNHTDKAPKNYEEAVEMARKNGYNITISKTEK